jgi:hypothetical protein
MPGCLVPQGATVICSHGGQAQPSVTDPRVKVAGQPVVQLSSPYTVSGCPLPPVNGGPCATAVWTAGTTRVQSLGQPLIIQGGTATCVPTGVPLQVTAVQSRVRGT